MKTRGSRLTLVLMVVAGIVAATYRVHQLEARREASTSIQRAVEDEARHLLVLMADLAAAERSYVVGGQGFDFWSSRVTSLFADLDGRLQRLRALADSDMAQQAVDTARSVVGDLQKLDGSVREHLGSYRRLLATDLIFTDAVQLMATASQQIESARTTIATTTAARIAEARWEQLWWLAGVAVLALVSLLLLARLPRPQSVPDAVATPSSSPGDVADLYIRSPPGSVTDAAVARPDLVAAARLCTDLACVTEPSELTALFERAAAVLNARGLVLWLADDSRTELRPALVQGYAPETIARLGSMPCASENATAAAFRQANMMTVPGAGASHGAIVAPVMSAGGCLGALAIEVPDGVEREEQARALATILAAQLSGLVGPSVPPATSVAQAQA